MPIASKVKNRTESIVVDLNPDDKLTLHIKVNSLDREFAQKQKAAKDDDSYKMGLDYIIHVTDSWDFFEDDGVTMLPLTFDRLNGFISVQMMNVILDGIQDKLFPPAKSSTNSSNTSTPTETSASSPGGTPISVPAGI